MAESSPAAAPRPGGRRRAVRRRRWVATGAAVATLGMAVGGVSIAAGRAGASPYRLAIAEIASVAQAVDAVGTVSSVSRADAAFSVAGSVESVLVAVGDDVIAGQPLATLDPSELQDAVEEASAALAAAEQQLEDDLDSQTVTSTDTVAVASTGVGTGAGTGTGTGTETLTMVSAPVPTVAPGQSTGGEGGPDSIAVALTPAVDAAIQEVRKAQEDLLAAHGVATELLAVSQTSLATARTSCDSLLGDEPSDGATDEMVPADPDVADPDVADPDVSDPDVADPDVSDPDVSDSDVSDPDVADSDVADPDVSDPDVSDSDVADPDVADPLTACLDAVEHLLTDQEAVADAQGIVDAMATVLDASVAAARQAVVQASVTSSPGASSDASVGGTAGGTADPSAGGTSDAVAGGTAGSPSDGAASGATTPAAPTGAAVTVRVASAEDLLADQAAIDAAEAELAIAQLDLELVTLTTPIAGTVAAVALEVGDQVQASSSTAVVSVLGEAGYLVTTTLDLSDVDTVDVGQTATVSVTSLDEGLAATVTSIGVLNVSTTSTPSYTVVLGIDPTEATLYNGSSAQVLIDVAAQDATLTVPTSAVHRTDDGATVQQVVDGSLVDVEVGIGTVGSERTEISSGLVEGDQVVVADLTAALVSDTEPTDGGLSGLGGESTTTPTTPGRVGGGGGQGGPPQGG